MKTLTFFIEKFGKHGNTLQIDDREWEPIREDFDLIESEHCKIKIKIDVSTGTVLNWPKRLKKGHL